MGRPTNGDKLLGVVGHHVVGRLRLLRLRNRRGHTPGDERLSVHQILEVRRAGPGVGVTVAATLAVVGAAVVDNRPEVPPLLLLDLLPGLDRKSDVLGGNSLLLVVLIGFRAEPLQNGEGALVSYPVTHLIGIHPQEEGIGQLSFDLLQADSRYSSCLNYYWIEDGVSDL